MTVETTASESSPTTTAAMLSLGVDVLAELLFCSDLQPSQQPTTAEVLHTLTRCLSRGGDPTRDCAAQLASDYGKCPDSTCERMRWARFTVLTLLDRQDLAA